MAEIKKLTDREIAFMTDHTFLKADGTEKDIERICQEAIDGRAGAVCVRERFVALATDLVGGHGIHVAAAICFPERETSDIEDFLKQLDRYSTRDKVNAAYQSALGGAKDVDMIMDIRALKRYDWGGLMSDINEVVSGVYPLPVKVILENCFLSREEKVAALSAVTLSRASYAKSNTGYGPMGAQVEDIELFSMILPETVSIKPSSKISYREQAQALYDAAQKHRPHKVRFGASKLLKNLA